MQTFVVAAPASGSGKTTVTLALLAALTRRGLAVAPFKVGPDFIDPGHHTAACGRISRNLDLWMCGEDGVRRSFRTGGNGAQVAVIEGVMGLFDGARGETDEGSTAAVARFLNAPVLLVVDAKGQARSVAALVKGFVDFDPQLTFAGVILNRVASDRHAELLAAALASTPGLPPLLGCLPKAPEVEMPSRHLGLVTANDLAADGACFDRLADWLEKGVDVGRLLERPPSPEEMRSSPTPGEEGGRRPGEGASVKIAVARDAAFCFCYPENLELLEAAGAELAFFSPLWDTQLPSGCQGLYLPGGYPELHAEQLAANVTLRAEIRAFAAAGRPVYAECGGLIYLSEGVVPVGAAPRGCPNAGEHMGSPLQRFVGLFPAGAKMLPKRKALGYREVTFNRDTILGPAGAVARGHEFHYSELELPESVERVYRLRRTDGAEVGTEGFVIGRVLASYVHLHFASNPDLAANFVAACRTMPGEWLFAPTDP